MDDKIQDSFKKSMEFWRKSGHLTFKKQCQNAGFKTQYVVMDDYTDYWLLEGKDGKKFSTDALHRDKDATYIIQLQSFLQGVNYGKEIANV